MASGLPVAALDSARLSDVREAARCSLAGSICARTPVSMAPRRAAPAVAVLAVTTVLAHLEFPVWFWDALFYQKGGAIIDLCVRDVLTVAIGVMALWAATRTSKETIVLDS